MTTATGTRQPSQALCQNGRRYDMALIWPCVRLPFWQQTLTSCQGHSDKLSALYKYKIYTKETGRFALKGLPFTTADASDFVKSLM